jgi:N-acetylglucosamine malate deacetylase 2
MNAVVVAHPDDEIVGLGAQLPRFRDAVFIHVTDGAPRDLLDARAYGFSTREEYAAARRRELLDALALAGIPPDRCRHLGFVDQEGGSHLAEIARKLRLVFRELRPDFVVTHAYEGGHPDHDATAFACHAARRLCLRDEFSPGLLIEFASYHIWDDVRVTGDFLPNGPRAVLAFYLAAGEQVFKRKLMSCFRTQQHVLTGFGVEHEKFRIAPEYDFTRPPHEGLLHYERHSWGMNGRAWRQNAEAALLELGL